jgi:UPF0755 protein
MSPKSRLYWIIAVVTVFVLGVNIGTMGFVGWQGWIAPGPAPAETIMIVKQGQGLRDVAQNLDRTGIIHSQYIFIAMTLWQGRAADLKPGEYSFPAHAPMQTVQQKIIKGEVVQHFFTAIEGSAAEEVRKNLLADARLVGDLPDAIAEGSVLPDTYAFTRGEKRAALLARMQAAMTVLEPQLWPARAADLPLQNWAEAVTLASIVEKETAIESERGRVAAVYINRLRRGMPLQADPTVAYAMAMMDIDLPDGLRHGHLRRDHPYNTYTRAGLPPGPIANPRRASIEAVLNPPATNEYYFVADGKGGHIFAKTLDEHNRNVAAWRRLQARNGDSGR